MDIPEKLQEKIDEIYTEAEEDEEEIGVVTLFTGYVYRKLFQSWKLMEIEFVGDPEDSFEEDIWDYFSVDLDEWMQLADIAPSAVNLQKAENLFKHKIVFPDNRLHYWVEQELEAENIKAKNRIAKALSGDS